jgi:hypothetical protein
MPHLTITPDPEETDLFQVCEYTDSEEADEVQYLSADAAAKWIYEWTQEHNAR